MLFARAVDARLPSGDIVQVYPQRTTNLWNGSLEIFNAANIKEPVWAHLAVLSGRWLLRHQ